jgi:hypothetical protein
VSRCHVESAESPNGCLKMKTAPRVRGRAKMKLGNVDQRETLTRREPLAALKVGMPVPFS